MLGSALADKGTGMGDNDETAKMARIAARYQRIVVFIVTHYVGDSVGKLPTCLGLTRT